VSINQQLVICITNFGLCKCNYESSSSVTEPPLDHPFKVGSEVPLDPSAFLADSDLIQALVKRAASIPCNEDRVLFRQGDPPVGLYILSVGEALVSMDTGADELEFSCVATAGSVLGLPALIAHRPYSLTAIARKGASLGFIDKDEFQTLVQTELPLMSKVLRVLAAEVRSARLAIIQR
jgi:CRP-like cAMP-binding protein